MATQTIEAHSPTKVAPEGSGAPMRRSRGSQASTASEEELEDMEGLTHAGELLILDCWNSSKCKLSQHVVKVSQVLQTAGNASLGVKAHMKDSSTGR